jgi:membrane associated rhomboid family serine protease
MTVQREVRCSCGALNDPSFATCVRCGRRLVDGAPVPRPTDGPRHSDEPRVRAGWVLGGLCSLVFAMQLTLALKRGVPLGSLLVSSGHPADALRVGALLATEELLLAEPFRLVSSVFVHFGLLHFGMNMYGFVGLARAAEHLVGSARTIVAFVLTGVLGFVVSAAVQILVLDRPVLTAGASGGILGTMGLLVGALLRRGDPRWKQLATSSVLYTLLFGFAVNASGRGIAVNNAAHIGGLVVGLALGFAWGGQGDREGPKSRAAAAIAVILSIASLVLAQWSELPTLLERSLG